MVPIFTIFTSFFTIFPGSPAPFLRFHSVFPGLFLTIPPLCTHPLHDFPLFPHDSMCDVVSTVKPSVYTTPLYAFHDFSLCFCFFTAGGGSHISKNTVVFFFLISHKKPPPYYQFFTIPPGLVIYIFASFVATPRECSRLCGRLHLLDLVRLDLRGPLASACRPSLSHLQVCVRPGHASQPCLSRVCAACPRCSWRCRFCDAP